MANETDFKVGQECYFESGGGQCRVWVTSKTVRADTLYLGLKLLEVIVPPLLPTTEGYQELVTDGVLEVSRKIGCSISRGSWELKPL